MAYKNRDTLAKENKELVDKLNEQEQENEKMKNKMNSIEIMLQQLMEEKAKEPKIETEKVAKTVEGTFVEEEKEILPNEYIKVMSLLDNTMNLTTDMYGKGKVFEFNRFGQERSIQYSDLENIIHNQEKFLKNGCFLILDERVNMRHGLNEVFEKVMDKEAIERILFSNDKADVNLFIAASDTQKDAIINLYIRRNVDTPDEDIDYNKVKLFSKYSGRNVEEMLVEYKTLK